MPMLFRGRLSQVAIAILTAEVVLLSGCNGSNGSKSSFWRMAVRDETENQSGSFDRDEEMRYDDSAPSNSYREQSYQDYNKDKASPELGTTPSWDIFYSTKQNTSTDSSGMPTSATAAGDWGAVAAYGEIAPRNFRGSGTYGVYLTPLQRFKVSGEYLTQKLDFHFNSGNRKTWVSQMAFGAEYQYLLKDNIFKSLEMGTAYSHAFRAHHNLSSSNASLSFLGTTARLWTCAFLSVAAEYDWIKFGRKHHHDGLSNGFGGSVDFVQQFGKDFSLNLGAQFRKPFNSYQGLLNWNHRFSSCNLDIGIFGNITEGHHGISDIRTVGLQLGVSLGPKPKSCGRSVEMSASGKECYARQYCDVSQWVTTPAVYVPVVLVIADQPIVPARKCNGAPPTLTGLSNLDIFDVGIDTAPTAPFFSSALPLTYSLTIDPVPPMPPGASLTIDPITGVITAVNPDVSVVFTVHITATNDCGSATVTTTATFGTS